jgi:hypothetical protein
MDGHMKLSAFADLVLRVVAVLTAIPFVFLVLVVGIMANDASNAAGERASMWILCGGGLLVLWVLFSSIKPALIIDSLPSWPVLRFVLGKLPSYIFGVLGLAWGASYAYTHFRYASLNSKANVKPGDREYPAPNPHPSHTFEVVGTLPTAIPVGDFLAVYASDITPEKVSGPCQVLYSSAEIPKELWTVEPLTKEDPVPLIRSDGRYRATFVMDRYLPGRCNWHLKSIRYRLFVSSYGYKESPFEFGTISVFDERHPPVGLPEWETVYRGRTDVWCGVARNKAVTPYYPEYCGQWRDYYVAASDSLRESVPTEATETRAEVMALPDTVSIELNFHDLNAQSYPEAAPRARP